MSLTRGCLQYDHCASVGTEAAFLDDLFSCACAIVCVKILLSFCYVSHQTIEEAMYLNHGKPTVCAIQTLTYYNHHFSSALLCQYLWSNAFNVSLMLVLLCELDRKKDIQY